MKMNTMKTLMLASLVVLLNGCGGGGSSSTSGNLAPIDPMPVWSNPYGFAPEIITQASTMGAMINTTTIDDCETLRAGAENSNSPCSIFAPTAQQSISGINLSIDASSTSNDLVVADSSILNLKYTQPLNWLGWEIANSSVTMAGETVSSGDLAFTTPSQEVRQAWANGFSGQGINALVLDSFDLQPTIGDSDNHGYQVMATLKSIAPNVNLFAMSYGFLIDPKVVTTNTLMSPDTKIDVITMSFAVGTANPAVDIISQFHPIFNGTSNYFTNSGDAVLINSAGNAGMDAYDIDRLSQTLLTDPFTLPRALIVGWVNSDDNFLSNGSDYAGSNPTMQEHFLVEYAISGFSASTNAFRMGESDTPVLGRANRNGGSSFAAPIVAGKVALLRSKFPTLNGANTARILLDTATYDGLACWNGTAGSCPVNQYGQGRINLPAALSPIGKLR